MAQMIAYEEEIHFAASAKLITVPSVELKILYSDGPAGILRKAPAQWKIFTELFDKKFKPRLETRRRSLSKQIAEDVVDWEIAAEKMSNEQRVAYAAKLDTELKEWLGRWVVKVNQDRDLSCNEAYKETTDKLKLQISKERFTGTAKAGFTSTIKIAHAVVNPVAGVFAAVTAIFGGAKTLKTTYDKFRADWGSLTDMLKAVNTDIAALENATVDFKHAGGKLEGYWIAVQMPAAKLGADVDRLDGFLVLARQLIQTQSAELHTLEEQLKKIGANPEAAKIQAHFTKMKTDREVLAADLTLAGEIKTKAHAAIEEMKKANVPEFAKLTHAVDEVKKREHTVEEFGKDIIDVGKGISDWLKHLPK